MNVGPTSRGYLDYRAVNCLKAYADWMKYNGRSIYNCGPAPEGLVAPADCRYTYNKAEKTLYLHILNWPFKHIHLAGLAGKIAYAQFLHDGSEVKMRDASSGVHNNLNSETPDAAVTFELPVLKPNTEVPVIEIFLK